MAQSKGQESQGRKKRKRENDQHKNENKEEEEEEEVFRDPLEVLGTDIMLTVLSYLDAHSLALSLLVSRGWNGVASSNRLWASKVSLSLSLSLLTIFFFLKFGSKNWGMGFNFFSLKFCIVHLCYGLKFYYPCWTKKL